MPYQSEIDAEFSTIDAILDEYTKRVPEAAGTNMSVMRRGSEMPSIEHEIAALRAAGRLHRLLG